MRLSYSLFAMIVLIGSVPTPALAADERRLSPAEVEQVLERAAQKRQAPTLPILAPVEDEGLPARPVQGEVGVSIGTGGLREVFGTAVVPLGEQGAAVISFESRQSHHNYRRRHR
jgi:hypothetical protein